MRLDNAQPFALHTDIREVSAKPQVIDLFAGVGGLSLGATRAGFRLPLAVEWDTHAILGHKVNFPNSEHWATDICAIDGDAILQKAGLTRGQLDGLIGGPPCQGFSVMGHQNADDSRNTLFSKFFELVSQCRPRFFVAENVPGILDNRHKNLREIAFGHVEQEYVLLEPMRIKAFEYGAPTVRDRVFFIGYLADEVSKLSPADFEKSKVEEHVKVKAALTGLPERISSDWLTEVQSWQQITDAPDSTFWNLISAHLPEGVGSPDALRIYREEGKVSGCFGTRHSAEVQARYARLKPGQCDRVSKATRLREDGFCPTLRAGTDASKGSYQAVRPIHTTQARVITPREAARLQGFPDWFQFAPSKWHSFRQIGNSVSPIVAEAVLRTIRSHL